MKRIFLIDSIGAVTTAVVLGVLLRRFESLFGMPAQVLVPLAWVAVAFSIYSLTCYVRELGAPFLFGIAAANTAYCLATLTLIVSLRHSLTWLGVAYFVGEIAIVMSLVAIEVHVARSVATSQENCVA
ncbi:MAG: hypothetical protein AAFQ65_09050 [Myxococcota bacterium]